MEKLTEKLSKVEDRSNFPPAWAPVAAIRRRCPSAGSVQEEWNTRPGDLMTKSGFLIHLHYDALDNLIKCYFFTGYMLK